MQEAIFNRYRSYRSLIVLVIVIVVQLLYLAYQVKTARDERLIRVWAVSAVTPMAGIVEAIRHNTIGFLQDYFLLLDVREQNRKLKHENEQLKMQNVFFRNQLSTAEHAKALTMFQAKTQSKTIAARVIGDSTVSAAKAVFVDRGSTSGIEKGMAVVTADGIVGKVVAVYPLASQVLLVTDSTFKVGVESQKGHIHGSLNCGSGQCTVEHISNEEDVSNGEWFYTSGEDRIFPRGFPVGKVVSAQLGQEMKDVKLNLSGDPGSVEEVLVVLDGVHQAVPVGTPTEDNVTKTLPPPPSDGNKEEGPAHSGAVQTEADKLVQKYQQIGKDENHVYGALYSNLPSFAGKAPGTAKPAVANATPPPAPPPSAVAAPMNQPAAAPGRTVLGAGAQTTHPAATTKAASGVKHSTRPAAKPVLPLGSPRPKAAATTPSTEVRQAPSPQ